MDLLATPEAELTDAITGLYASAISAKQGRLNTKAADVLVDRLRWHAERMILSDQRDLLHESANQLERLSSVTTRIKADGGPTRAKAAPRPAPGPSSAQLVEQFDAEMMSRGSPFSVNDFEEDERRRVEAQNAALAERDRRHEAQRRGR